ncbi:MAG: ATP-binding protein [Sporomusaceae bacterium]|nr:ATP-binding protein [Sporomusaceae bacterium]
MYCFSTLAEFSALRESIKAELVRTSGEDAQRIFIAINEGVNNAIFHGNKEDNSKKVYLTIESHPSEIKIVIRDEGNSFLNQERTHAIPWFQEHGRGFQLIQHCVDSYQLNTQGNEITMIKKNTVA